MENVSNSIANKRRFKICLFHGCPIYGRLTIKEGKGTLKYYDAIDEIKTIDLMSNYNKLVVESIIHQAETICMMKYVTLWSY